MSSLDRQLLKRAGLFDLFHLCAQRMAEKIANITVIVVLDFDALFIFADFNGER
jgi:hypothetical protein